MLTTTSWLLLLIAAVLFGMGTQELITKRKRQAHTKSPGPTLFLQRLDTSTPGLFVARLDCAIPHEAISKIQVMIERRINEFSPGSKVILLSHEFASLEQSDNGHYETQDELPVNQPKAPNKNNDPSK